MRERRRHQSETRSSQTAMIAVVLAAGALVLLFLVFSGTKDEPAPAPPQTQKPAKPTPKKDPRQERKNQARSWFEGNFFDGRGNFRKLSGREIHKLFAEAEEKGYPALLEGEWQGKRKRVYRRLLEREPNDPDANRFFGRFPLADYPDFFKVFGRMCGEKALPKEYAKLRDRYEGEVRYGPTWRTPAVGKQEFDRVGAVLRRYEAYAKRMDQNPAEKAIAEALARIKLHPLLGSYDTVHIVRRPWVLFYAHRDLTPRDESRKEKGRVQARRKALEERLDSFTRLLGDYLAFFRRGWMKPLGLKEFEPRDLHFIWLFGDRKTFDAYGRSIGQVNPPGLLGYFDPRTRWVYVYEDTKDRTLVEWSLSHELTHQLHWHFSQDSGPFHSHFERSKAVWFKEGWAEYLGQCKRQDGGYTFLHMSQERMNSLHTCRKRKIPLYPVKELVKTENYAQATKEVAGPGGWIWKKLGVEAPSHERRMLMRMLYLHVLYAESWLFVRYVHEKYPDQIREFTRANLKGYQGYRGESGYAQAHEVFEQTFGIEGDAGWARIQKEFDEYLEAKMYEMPPTKGK